MGTIETTIAEAVNTANNTSELAPTKSPWPHGVKFAHFRNTVVQTKRHRSTGQIVNVTCAYQYVNDDNGNKILEIGFAFCSTQDSFSYASGREIAYKRLTSSPVKLHTRNKSVATPREIIDGLMYLATTTHAFPIPGLPNSWLYWSGIELGSTGVPL